MIRGAALNIARILADLKSERDRIDRAIKALSALESTPVASKPVTRAVRRKRGGLTPEGRKRLSEAMKKRWAERRKKRG
jgi:Spy/CpxP family protein refolding chaperone